MFNSAQLAPMIADVSFTTEGITTISVLLVSLVGAITFLFRGWMKDKDEHLIEMKTQRDEYKKVAVSVTDVAEKVILRQLTKRGITPVEPIAPVLAEHDSPVTESRQDKADFATLQARRRAVDLALEQLLIAEEDSVNALPKPPPIQVEIVGAAVTVPVEVVAPLPVEIVATDPVPVKVIDKETK